MRRFRHPALILILLLGLALGVVAPAAAQTASDGSTAGTDRTVTVTIDELQGLVSTLENEARRTEFLDNLRALIASKQTDQAKAKEAPGLIAGVTDTISERIDEISRQFVAAADALLDLPHLVQRIYRDIADPEIQGVWAIFVLKLAAVLIAGLLGEAVTRAVLRGPRGRLEHGNDSVWVSLLFVLLRAILDIVPIAAFAAVAYGALTVLEPARGLRIVAVALINAIILTRLVATLARMIVSPNAASLRLIPAGDETANYIYVWVRRLANVSIYGFLIIHAARLLGLSLASYLLLLKLLGLAIGMLLIMLVLQNRQEVADLIRGKSAGAIGKLRRRISEFWHILLILFLIVAYGVWALGAPGGFAFLLRGCLLTAVIVAGTWLLVAILSRLVEQGFALSDELQGRFPGLEERANRYLPALKTAGKILVYGFALLALLQVWGLGTLGWFTTPVGSRVLGRGITIALIVVVALIGWEMLSATIERYLDTKDAEGNRVERSQRMRTLLPLVRNFAFIMLAALVLLTVLSEVGLDITPLLAGAGIVGLAIGFGAQNLVKDVITGLFILLEDSVRVGDVAEVAGHSGIVEAMSIRSMQLRDLSGGVHRVPFGEVSTVVNLTKDFSFALMYIRVAYRENVDDVIEVLEETGAEMRRDDVWGKDILDDIEIHGLDEFTESAVIIRCRIKTKPIQQWGVRREFYRRLKRRFDELNINMPFPHRTIYFGADRQGQAPAAPVRIEESPPQPEARQQWERRSPEDSDAAAAERRNSGEAKDIIERREEARRQEVAQEDAEKKT